MEYYFNKYKEEILELIKKGKELKKFEKPTKNPNIRTVQAGDKLTEWLTNVENIVNIIFNKGQFQFDNFQIIKQKKTYYFSTIQEIYGFLQGILNDINNGLLIDLSSRLTTKISSNIIDNAKELNNNNYSLASAIYTRIAIETHLKSVAEQNSINPKQPASKLKDEIYKKGIFDKHERSKIQSWLDFGNYAAHGLPEFNNYNKSQINDLISEIERFIAKS